MELRASSPVEVQPYWQSISDRKLREFGQAYSGTAIQMGGICQHFRVGRMFFRSVTVTISVERLGDIRLDEQDAVVDIPIALYKRDQVSLGRAAEIAGMPPPAFLAELTRRQIPINYKVDDLRADLETLKKLP